MFGLTPHDGRGVERPEDRGSVDDQVQARVAEHILLAAPRDGVPADLILARSAAGPRVRGFCVFSGLRELGQGASGVDADAAGGMLQAEISRHARREYVAVRR